MSKKKHDVAEELLANYKKPEDLIGEDVLLKYLTKLVVERALDYLALRNISKKWTMPIRDWKAALTRFTIQFGDRIALN